LLPGIISAAIVSVNNVIAVCIPATLVPRSLAITRIPPVRPERAIEHSFTRRMQMLCANDVDRVEISRIRRINRAGQHAA
jgi:hypothetical protein